MRMNSGTGNIHRANRLSKMENRTLHFVRKKNIITPEILTHPLIVGRIMYNIILPSSPLKLLFRQKVKEGVSQLLTVCHKHCNSYQSKGNEDSESYHNELPGNWTQLNQHNKTRKSLLIGQFSILITICVAWKQGKILYKSIIWID